MADNQRPASEVQSGTPIANFSQCHVGILGQLQSLDELPTLVLAAARARSLAEKTLAFFRGAVYDHHEEEERDLFPAVLASAIAGPERERVQVLVSQLIREHRTIEAMWTSLEPQLKRVARGQASELDPRDVKLLVHDYSRHAAVEEREFLPLSQTILSRNSFHTAALGMSLHIRHAAPPLPYI